MKMLMIVMMAIGISLSVHAAEKNQVVNLEVTKDGFQPGSIFVKPGVPVVLNVTRKVDSTCSKQIQIPSMKIKKDLPLNKMVAINIGTLDKGEIKFGCGMNMMDGGMIIVK